MVGTYERTLLVEPIDDPVPGPAHGIETAEARA
jgi:hypothetical protein